MLEPGDQAPEFEGLTESGDVVSLLSLRGQVVVLYFYPKDDTPGCTRQACSYRDHATDFHKIGARVYGISLDGLEEHASFREKYGLNFPLLVDTKDGLCAALGVYREQEWKGKQYMGLARDTFLVDPQGNIARLWRQVNPDTTMGETLAELKSRM